VKALVVDDEKINLLLLERILEPLKLELSFANNGLEAKNLLIDHDFDILLFDIMMPEINGIDLTRWTKEQPAYKDVPVLILTSLSDKQTLLDSFDAGAVDYLTKPFFGPELVHRVQAHLKLRELQRRMETFANELNVQILKAMQTEQELLKNKEALAEANKALADWAHKDTLTGLWNRRKATSLMEYEASRSNRNSRPIGIAMLDLDKFKSVNDSLGHDAGDLVLKTAASVLAETLRSSDILARWGGEEFLAVFPETDLQGTIKAAEKLRLAVQNAQWSLPDRPGMTVSIGVAIRMPDMSWDDAIKTADLGLYRAKEGGRNRVEADWASLEALKTEGLLERARRVRNTDSSDAVEEIG